ncbi:helix-turn-helix domain-containing protein [Streptomyces sp. NPDC052040]|uniref:helix-turn-helix domain-containing protein n=1 Tax=Streptomyces sp. NPDC052040 TaxID=3365682 RepID=UPI0037D67717
MSAWQPLPDGLPSEVRHFVEQLRLLKDRTGLSLVALGARTAYSKSSWQRYLNAVQPPPRHAVAALCRVAGIPDEEAERFGVRWELAVHAWPRQPAPVAAPVAGPAAAPGRGPGLGAVPGPGLGPMPGAGPGSMPGPVPDFVPGSVPDPVPGGYEDDPTVPWWERPAEVSAPRPAPGRRLLLVALLALLALLVVALAGVVALG